jgi:hypothetical protein
VRTEANAATAYLALGDVRRAVDFGSRALASLDAGSAGSPQALTRLDLATALVHDPRQAEPEQAAELVKAALAVPGADAFRPVIQRADEVVPTLRRWRELPAVVDALDVITEVRQRQRTLP